MTMHHRPLIPVSPKKHMDAKHARELRRERMLHRAARRLYSKRYYAKNRREILKWAKRARLRHAHGDKRITRHETIPV